MVFDQHDAPDRGTEGVVPADAPHRIEAGAEEGTVVFLEPESTLSGTGLAARVGLSASRLTHLFTEQVGIPLSRYQGSPHARLLL